MTLTLSQLRSALAAAAITHPLTPTNVIDVQLTPQNTIRLVFDTTEHDTELSQAAAALHVAESQLAAEQVASAELTRRILEIRETSITLSKQVT